MPLFGEKKKSTFETDIVLGEKYRDKATGFEGTAKAVYFYEHACERVALTGMNTQGEVVEYVFDSPELESVATQETPRVKTPGGPHDLAPVRR